MSSPDENTGWDHVLYHELECRPWAVGSPCGALGTRPGPLVSHTGQVIDYQQVLVPASAPQEEGDIKAMNTRFAQNSDVGRGLAWDSRRGGAQQEKECL